MSNWRDRFDEKFKNRWGDVGRGKRGEGKGDAYYVKQFIQSELSQQAEEIAKQLSLTILLGEKLENEGEMVDWAGKLRAFIKYELKGDAIQLIKNKYMKSKRKGEG